MLVLLHMCFISACSGSMTLLHDMHAGHEWSAWGNQKCMSVDPKWQMHHPAPVMLLQWKWMPSNRNVIPPNGTLRSFCVKNWFMFALSSHACPPNGTLRSFCVKNWFMFALSSHACCELLQADFILLVPHLFQHTCSSTHVPAHLFQQHIPAHLFQHTCSSNIFITDADGQQVQDGFHDLHHDPDTPECIERAVNWLRSILEVPP